MNGSLEIALQGAWAMVALTLFVQTSVVMAIGLAASRVFSTGGPAMRSAILRATLIAVVLCPTGSVLLKRLGVPAVGSYPHSVAVSTHEPAARRETILPLASGPVMEAHRAVAVEKVPAFAPSPVKIEIATAGVARRYVAPVGSLLPQVIAVAWIGITAMLVARILVANVLIAWIRAGARPVGAAGREMCDRLAGEMEIKAPAVLVTPKVSGPSLVGWLRPAILLPEGGDGVEREVLIHELAHAQRGDCAWQLLAQLVRAVVWFQPLAWVLPGELERAAEEACDDLVLQWGGDRAAYASRLLALAGEKRAPWATAGVGAGVVGFHSSVGKRIERLLDSKRPLARPLGRRACGVVLCGAALLTAGAALLRAGETKAISQQSAAASNAKGRGRVTDSEGRPVGGAEVFLVRPGGFQPEVIEMAKTDAEGNLVLQTGGEPSPSGLEVNVFAPGRGVGLRHYDPASECDVQLQPMTKIALTLRDPDGRPIAGMKAYPLAFVSKPSGFFGEMGNSPHFFLRMSAAMSQRMSGTTDANGMVMLENLPQNGRMELGFDDERFAYPGVGQRIALSDDQRVSAPVTVQLEKGATISGILRYAATGQGAPGTRISAQPTDGSASRSGGGECSTGADGAYRLTHLGAGRYNLMVYLSKDVQKDWTAAAHEGVMVSGGQATSNMNFALVKGGLVTGRVLAADTGKPLEGTGVGAHGPAHPRSSASIQSAETAADGTYLMRVPPGTQHVYICGPVPAAYRQAKQEMHDVSVAEGQTVTVDFKLERREGDSVDGIVVGLDGKPAAGIPVTARDEEMMLGSSAAVTDAGGRFHFDSLPPHTPLIVQTNDVCTTQPVYFQKGHGEVRLQLVKRVKLTLKGLIVDEQGKPVVGARIRLSQSFGRYGIGESEPRLSGAEGRYEIKDLFTDNDYSIAADGDGFGEVQAHLDLDAKTTELPTVKLPRADATTGGVVVDSEGKPVAGITVNLNNGMSPKSMVTDAQGRFSFAVVGGTSHLIWLRSKERGKVGPYVQGYGGRNDLKLVLPEWEW